MGQLCIASVNGDFLLKNRVNRKTEWDEKNYRFSTQTTVVQYCVEINRGRLFGVFLFFE